MKGLTSEHLTRLDYLRERMETLATRKGEVDKPTETPEAYLTRIGWNLYGWQSWVLGAALKWRFVMLVAARQVGKTFIASGRARHQQVSVRGSSTPVVCPNQDKSKIVIKRVGEIALRDPGHVRFDPDNTEEVGEYGSTIKALPGTLGGVVGETAPLLMLDEGGLISRALYDAATPMQAHIEDPELWVMSSAWYQDGWFWEGWDRGPCRDRDGVGFVKVLVRPALDLVDHCIVPLDGKERFEAEQAEKGVHVFWSETPTAEFLTQELATHTEMQIRQQYFCEFQPMEDKALPPEYLEKMWTEGAARRLDGRGEDGSMLSEGEGRRV